MIGFNDYLAQKETKEELSEASLIGKGFGLIQRNQFEAKRRQLASLGTQIKDAAIDARLEKDAIKKLDKMATALKLHGVALGVMADMGTNLMNAVVASIIDSPDLKKALQDALKTR